MALAAFSSSVAASPATVPLNRNTRTGGVGSLAISGTRNIKGPYMSTRVGTSQQQALAPFWVASRRLEVACAAAPEASTPAPSSHPRATLQKCLRIAQRKERQWRNALLPYLPSQEIARGHQYLSDLRKQEQEGGQATAPVLFESVIEGMLLGRPADHFLDSFALRTLILTPPSEYQELSGLMVSPGTYVSRCSVSAPSGEETILTFKLKRNDVPSAMWAAGGPPSDYKPGAFLMGLFSSTDVELPPAPADHAEVSNVGPEAFVDMAPMGVRMPPKDEVTSPETQAAANNTGGWPYWRLASVKGEPRFNVSPRTPSPEFPPEKIVEAQLDALRTYDFAQAFELLSPDAQALVGPIDRFIASMSRSKLYRPLVNHASSMSMRRCQSNASTYLEMVAVEPDRPGEDMALYCWVVSKQTEPGPLQGCWMTEWVKVVNDPNLRYVLGLPAHPAEQSDGDK